MYAEFLARKAISHQATGIAEPPDLSPLLKPFQRDVTRWALQKGRAATFLDCGLGKSWIAIEWARVVMLHTQRPVLILTPLAVAQQFIREGRKMGLHVSDAREAEPTREYWAPGIWVANYESMHKLERMIPQLGGVVTDESSILKNFNGATRTQLIETFRPTPLRLCCTATPSPNDPVELGNHAEFLGVMRHVDMLNRFFEHDAGDTGTWVLKGWARRAFWRWVSSWAVCMNKPSDMGYSDDGYDLPPLELHEHVVDVDQHMARKAGLLFAYEASTLSEQREVRRASIEDRVAKSAALVNAGEQWLVWAQLNDESQALTAAIDGAVEVSGSDKVEVKEQRILDFLDGKTRVLVTKPSILAFGLNAQCCARQLFVGADHSFEQWYQAVRRSWRFGQTRSVHVHMVRTSADGRITDNLRRKQEEFQQMHREMADAVNGRQCA
jgi:superfamily II DNA or RNA helicase